MQITQHLFAENSSQLLCKLIAYFHLRFERVYENPEQILSYGIISYILSGKGEYKQGNVTIPMKKGDLIIINPYTPHIESSSETDPIEHLYFYFNSSVFDDKKHNRRNVFFLDDETTQEKIHIFDFSEYHAVFEELKDMFEHEIREKKPHYETKLQYAFYMLLIEILRKTELTRRPSPPVTLNKSMRIPVAVVQYLESYYTFQLSLDKIADRFYVSKTYLAYIFKKTYGMTVMEYLNKIRLEEAKRHLHTSDMNISAVAAATGFVNASYFARAYKKYFGRTPSEEIRLATQNKQTD